MCSWHATLNAICISIYFRKKLRLETNGSLDADDPIEDDSDDSFSEEDEDDTAELMAELQRIKAERAADLAKKVCFQLCPIKLFLKQGFLLIFDSLLNKMLKWFLFTPIYPITAAIIIIRLLPVLVNQLPETVN